MNSLVTLIDLTRVVFMGMAIPVLAFLLYYEILARGVEQSVDNRLETLVVISSYHPRADALLAERPQTVVDQTEMEGVDVVGEAVEPEGELIIAGTDDGIRRFNERMG